ncbi:carbohydrate kinase family protein [bacterium]|nr:carbohydrate kinase family protein [bacterium]
MTNFSSGGCGILIGTGGIGSGIFFQLVGDHTLGRDESREGVLLEARDFCKLHIIEHYVAALLGPNAGRSFRTVALGAVGADSTGAGVLELMSRTGIEVDRVEKDPQAATTFSVCFQYPDSAGGNITTANSASARVRPEDILKAEGLFAEYAGHGIALAAPEAPLAAREALLELAAAHGFLSVSAFTSAELHGTECRELLSRTGILVLNRDEAQALTGLEAASAGREAICRALEDSLLPLNPQMRICLTLGAEGSAGFEDGAWEFTPPAKVTVVSTAGAGDATTAGVIVAAASGLPFILRPPRKRVSLGQAPLASALDFAALVASFSVTAADTIHLGASRAALRMHAQRLGTALSGPVEALLAD